MLLKMHEAESMEFARILSDPKTNAMAKADKKRRDASWSGCPQGLYSPKAL